MRNTRYQIIADDIRSRIVSGEFGSGGVLPSENELSKHYEASRVTIRRSLETLRAERLVESRQGYGWIIAADPLRQDLSRLDTLERQLAGAGIESERKVLSFGFAPAPARVQSVLGDKTVLEVRRVHEADGAPFARVTVWCPELLGAELSRSDVERTSFLEQLPVELGGATQTIGAGGAEPADAMLLGIPEGSPVLIAERITYSSEGQPVLVSEHVFPGHRTEFAVELPSDVGALPPGLRFVE
jgi:GntR family transcriptional regulator